ncbi:hypothetical protein [Bradyrhizobium liaoningense]|uniref:hypothetical protein n=1 Tax=Bradyrhizobium liaoningense TaxID=43992 RepID=UPI001BA6648F|nr:hypothetical protein [Bradyrhizobium liaoningense]MBR0857247.1 hypothetical protein [Bradyrhizobium liaoningense]
MRGQLNQRGPKPSDLPIERPTRFKLLINRSVAKALGLTIAPSLNIGADEILSRSALGPVAKFGVAQI